MVFKNRIISISKLINNIPISNCERAMMKDVKYCGDVLQQDYYRDLYNMSLIDKSFNIDENFILAYQQLEIPDIPKNINNLSNIYSLLLDIYTNIFNSRELVNRYKYKFSQELSVIIINKLNSGDNSQELKKLLYDFMIILNSAFIYDPSGQLIDDWTYDTLRNYLNKLSNNSNINDLFKLNDLSIARNIQVTHKPIFPTKLPPIFKCDVKEEPLVCTNNYEHIKNDLSKAKPINEELSGSLDKLKCVETVDDNMGLDRWLRSHIDSGIIDSNNIELIVEYKYDGVATETEMCGNNIIQARTRGNKEQGICNDISNLLKYLPFEKENNDKLLDSFRFGMQFEILMSKEDLESYRIVTNKNYSNCRSAITSIVTSLDGTMLRNFITLAPIRTNLDTFVTRLEELEWIDRHFGVLGNKLPVVVSGDYNEVLNKISNIYNDAFNNMGNENFLYDGLVVSFNDKGIEKKLGRVNNINQFSIALKFPNIIKQAKFLGYNLTVGKNGQITPMIKFSEIYFYGNRYTEASGASLAKIKKMGLRKGDIIDIEYTNYVLPSVLGRNEKLSKFNKNEPILNLDMICPSCGIPLTVSNSGKMLLCNNPNCEGKIIKRLTSMCSLLGLDSIGESTIKKLKIKNIIELLTLDIDKIRELGYAERSSEIIFNQILSIKDREFFDYEIFGSLGIDNLSNKKLQLIFNKVSPRELLDKEPKELVDELKNIGGIGEILANNIVRYFKSNKNIIDNLLLMLKIKFTKGLNNNKLKVVFTNVSTGTKLVILRKLGDDYVEDTSVTKSTHLIITGNTSSNKSSKEKKGEKYGIIIKNIMDYL